MYLIISLLYISICLLILFIRTKECPENDPSLAKYYFHYGQSLLYEAKSKSDIFGDTVTSTLSEHDIINNEEEEEEEEGEEGDIEEIVAKEENSGEVQDHEAQDNGEVENEDDQADGEVKEEGEEDDEGEGEGEEDDEREGEGEDEGDEEGEGEDPIETQQKEDTLELAWEILEVARSLASQEPQQEALLSDIYISLGEVYVENEFPDKAQEEFLKSLKLRMKLNNRRGQAEAYFMLSIAQELAKDSEGAIANLENAKKALKEENEINKIDDYDQMIKEIDEKIETINAIFTAPEVDPFTNEKFNLDTVPDSYTTTGFNKPTSQENNETTVVLQPRQKRKRNDEEEKIEEKEDEDLKKQKTKDD